MTDALCHLVADGNEVLQLKLVRSVEDIDDDDTTFGPEMCHQVFGENENIFGYSDLSIKLYYTAGSLQTYLGIEYSEQVEENPTEGVKADDIQGAMRKILAPGYVTNIDRFVTFLEKDKKFQPMGRLIHVFTATPRDGGAKHTFEIYFSEPTTPGYLKYHQRLQTFLLWYVDAASFIDTTDSLWTFFTVFEKFQTSEGDTRYATAAYSTVYRYYGYPSHMRPRISQVLTLPPFRRLGICTELLKTIYSYFTTNKTVIDMTVEDPSEDFQRIRDCIDAKNCSRLQAFQPEKLVQGFTNEMEKEARSELKINKKQARRVYEILRLKCTNTSDLAAYTKYRLDIKRRLNAPFQRRKLEVKKLKRTLRPDELEAAGAAPSLSDTHGRLASQYAALEDDYRRVIHSIEQDQE